MSKQHIGPPAINPGIFMHDGEGVCIRVGLGEIADWKAEGFRRYRGPRRRGRKLSKKKREAIRRRGR